MVTGKVPFDAPNPSAAMAKHLKAELVAPDHVVPDLSTGLCEIIEVCMQKKRDKRYDNTSEMLEDLEAVSRGESPTRARRRFDISSLASLEAGSNDTQVVDAAEPEDEPLLGQPLFWAAIAGWAVAAVLLVALILVASAK